MHHFANNEKVDAVIIGTGAGGSPLLARLARAGLKVVALEAGKHWNAATDFATDEREQDKLYWPYERLSAGADPLGFGRNNSGIGVGGSTLHFTAYTPRPQPDDFTIYSEFSVGKNWPITYYELEKYYDELEMFLGISGPSSYPWGPQRNQPYPLPPLPLNKAAKLMQRSCDELNIKTSPAANAALSASYYNEQIGWRHACINRGFCEAGCTTGAKASMDVTFIPLALKHGAEIRSECFATELIQSKQGTIEAVVYYKNGRQEKQLCNHVFLCAGAIETPRLLLINNLANRSGQVGKNFMAHTGMQVWGEVDELALPYKGIPGGLISEDMHRSKDVNFAGGYLLQSLGVMPVTYASQLARSTGVWGKDLRERMKAYNHVVGINMHGECLPHENNFLELSTETDEMNLPKPKIYFTNGDNEKNMTTHAKKIMLDLWNLAGVKNIWSYNRNAHTIGTCRMGDNAADAVVNKYGQSFEVSNLYICDNSVFPGSLSANPALTIMALSLFTADNFLKNKI